MTSPEPGWSADPAGAEGAYRWWDGTGWTQWMSKDPHAAPPETAADGVSQTDPGPSGEGLSDAEPGDETSASDPPATPPTPTKDYPAGYERGPKPVTGETTPATGLRHALRGPRLLALLAIVVAVVVVIAVVIYGNQKPSDPLILPNQPNPSGSSSASPSQDPTPPTDVALNGKTRKITVGSFSALVPGSPYTFDNNVLNYPPMLSAGVLATAPVNVKYDGEHTWFAALAIGELDPGVIAEGNEKKTADQVFAGLISINFSDYKTKTSAITTKTIKLPGTDRAATAQGRVSYQIKGVPSGYDQVSVLVVKITGGPWVGWMSSRPEKASSQVKKALQESIDSIKVG